MMLAVLSAGGGSLDRGEATRLENDLVTALRAAGAAEVERLGDPAHLGEISRRAHEANQRVLICADNLVAHPSLLRALATEPGGRSTALVVADPQGDLRDDRGQLLAAEPGAGTVRYLGALCVAPADLPTLARVAGSPDLLAALLDAGLVPVATPVRLLRAAQVHTTSELARARAEVAAVDEETARLRLAVKEKDDFFTTYAVSTWSPHVTRAAARLGLSPTAVTWLSVLLAGLAAVAFWQASRPAMIAGGILLYLGFVLDCVDGQLARYTRRFAPFGGWLDTMADRAKEYAVYAGLAAGAERIGLPNAWPLAIAAILLQTVRHMTDAWYGALHDEAATRPRPPIGAGIGARLSAASTKVQGETGSMAYWLKRIVVFPIGERWALIAVLAMLTDGRVALAGVVGLGLLAFAYTLVLRSLRSLSMRVAVLDKIGTLGHRDDGPLARHLPVLPGPLAFATLAAVTALALAASLLFGPLDPPAKAAVGVTALLILAAGLPARAPHDGPLDWLVPAALRAAEYLFVVAVGLAARVPPPIVFLLLFALALRHYDRTARMGKGGPAVRFGWDVRIVVLAALTLAGHATPAEAGLAAVAGGSFLLRAIADWRRS